MTSALKNNMQSSGSSETMELPPHWNGPAHARSMSICQFEEDANMATAAAVRADLDQLVARSAEERGAETIEHKLFVQEMDSFFRLFLRFLKSQSEGPIEWEKVNEPGAELVVPYSAIRGQAKASSPLLNKLAVLKLNGGLGTTMGCVGPKSAIEVRDGMTFLDLTVRQLDFLNSENNCRVPLLLMDSFNTEAETRKIVTKYKNKNTRLIPFKQSRFPRIKKDSLLPLPQHFDDPKTCWYPPGNADNYLEYLNSTHLFRPR